MFVRGVWSCSGRVLTIGATLCCLAVCFGCSKSAPRTQLVPIEPPRELMEQTQVQEWTPRTNGEFVQWAIERDRGLAECNADKAALREYVRTLQAGECHGASVF